MIELPDHRDVRAAEITSSPTFFLTGKAGAGKTTLVRNQIESDPHYGVLAATTGIAAVNLGEGVTTINSLLKYTIDDDLIERHSRGGGLVDPLANLRRKGYRWLVVDEVSVMAMEVLDIILESLDAVNMQMKVGKNDPPLGLMLVGDFAQLPPIKKKWLFESPSWERFKDHTVKLTTSYRQSNQKFLAALNMIREGNKNGGLRLKGAGCNFAAAIDNDYEGVTIFSNNEMVTNFNRLKLSELDTPLTEYKSSRWTALSSMPSDFKHIPETLSLKEGSLVMILSNDTKTFRYANGDLGYISGYGSSSIYVQLLRNYDIVEIFPVRRKHWVAKEKLQKELITKLGPDILEDGWGEVRSDPFREDMLVAGEIRYFPLRLAWASTVHKTQGLSLDRIQIDMRSKMFRGTPGMVYVALSRAREAEGVRIVGTPSQVYTNIIADRKVKAANLL